MSFTLLDQGSFTSTGVGVKINLPGDCDYFVTKNLTQMAVTNNVGIGFEWFPSLALGYGIEYLKSGGGNTMNCTVVTSGGFTYRNAIPVPEAAKSTNGAITQAATAVVTNDAHGYSNGDRVVLYGTTGMLQISGMAFTVSNVAANTFDLAGLDSSGFAAAATACVARRLPTLQEVEPAALFITKVTKATSAVVTLSEAHHFKPTQLIKFSVPADFGMVELNGLTGEVTAVGTYTITVNIDSTGFTTFAFPASATVPNAFAMAAPAGSRIDGSVATSYYYNVSDIPFKSGQFYPYMYLAAGNDGPAGNTSDVIYWQAWKSEV